MSANPVRPNCARPHSCSLDVRLDAMARSPLTRELKPEEHLDLDSFVTSWAWSEGDPLMLAGQKVSGSYLVVAGRVRVVRDTIDGRESTVDIASPGGRSAEHTSELPSRGQPVFSLLLHKI